MARRSEELLEFRDADTIFEHFAGDQKGLAFVIDPSQVDELIAKGWNVKIKKADDYCPEDRWILNAKIKYNCPEIYRPKVYRVVEGKKKVLLDEVSIENLAGELPAIKRIDALLRLAPWTYMNRTGMSAVVKEMYVVVEESSLAAVYDYDEPEDPNTPW